MLAVEPMSAGLRTIIYLAALLLFIAGAIGLEPERSKVSLTSAGLACFVLPAVWDSWASV
jgi:hypothetical protein